MLSGDLQIQYIGWACTLVGGFLCGLLTFWLLRPKPKRMLFQVADLPKPIPYASARGSKPPAPWDELERRVTELEAELREDSRLTTKCLIQNQCRLDEMDQRLTALENQRPKPSPEPLAPGVRVWRRGQHVRLLADGCFWGRESDSSWYTFEASERWTMEHCAELHGHERDEVVKDWMNRGNV